MNRNRRLKKQPDTKQTKQFSLMQSWNRCNIFNYNKLDASLYMIFYLVIPILITSISIYTTLSEVVALAYCYLSILISALNGIYDAINRWKSFIKTVHNTKILLIILANGAVCVYCLYIVLYTLMKNKIPARCDLFLLAYLVTIVISAWDFWNCIANELALKEYYEEGDGLR